MKEALALASKHPDLHDEFVHLVNIMHDAVRSKHEEFVRQLYSTKSSADLTNFFALIGGAKATVEIYLEQLKILGVSYLTEKLLRNGSDEHPQAVDIIENLWEYWVDATDGSLELAGRLVEANILPCLVEDVKHLDDSFTVCKIHSFKFEDLVLVASRKFQLFNMGSCRLVFLV